MIYVVLNHTRTTLRCAFRQPRRSPGLFFGRLAWTGIERILYYNSAMPLRARVSIVAAWPTTVDWTQQLHAVAPARGLEAIQASYNGARGDHGRKDFRIDRLCAAWAQQHRNHALARLDSIRVRRRALARAAFAACGESREVFVIGGAQNLCARPALRSAFVHDRDRARFPRGYVLSRVRSLALARALARARVSGGADTFDYSFVEYERT